ncbi:MAG: NADH-quinone oxidoreductase subunit C [bacterium]
MQQPQPSLFTTLLAKFPAALWLGFLPRSEGVIISVDEYHGLCSFLKNEQGFGYLSCLTAVDWPWKKQIEIVVHLENWERNDRLVLKVLLERDNPEVASLTDLWQGANFLEREVFDLFGVTFLNHPNLKRILSPEDETTFPLRKDFGVENNDEYGKAASTLISSATKLTV